MTTRVGLSSYSFFPSFLVFLPGLRVIRGVEDVSNYDLVIFPGGSDINPRLYGKGFCGATGIDYNRDAVELDIYARCKRLGTKVLGICRGHQLINALEGGILEQDLRPEHSPVHDVMWIGDDPLEVFYPEVVNSMHHQGYSIGQMGSSLIPTSIEPETKIVESARSENGKVLTVQFHPEFMDNTGPAFFNYIVNWSKE